MDDQVIIGRDFGSPGLDSLAELQILPEFLEKHVIITIEKGNRTGEGNVYRCLGKIYFSKGAFRKAIECHEKHLKIAKEIRDLARRRSSL